MTAFGPVGIIDIGSNSVRFVALGGAARVPSLLFNEKVVAALGRNLENDGLLDAESCERALRALARFRLLAKEMRLKKLHCVATAAVREAANGPQFLKKVASLGLKPRLLSGEEEAELAGLGVLSAIPWANGVVADLGGGSLELIGVARGAAGGGVSLPLGVLRIASVPDGAALRKAIAEAIGHTRLANAARGHGLYLVGGSFRALAQLDMRLCDHPLPITHQHRIRVDRLAELGRAIAELGPEDIKARTGLSSNRIRTLPAACAMLSALSEVLAPKRIVTSAHGLREGLLYRDLDASTREQDPLLAGALDIGRRLGRFGDHGAALDQWIAPLFPGDDSEAKRLRRTACLLGDIAWNAHPDYRAERAVDLAIHGDWVGIDANGRAMLGRTLCSAFGGDGGYNPRLKALLEPGQDAHGEAWGRALRLAQRLSGGTEGALRRTSVSLARGTIVLTLPERQQALYSEAVERRLTQLGKAMDRKTEVRLA